MFSKVLIANRATIACRVARTLKKMGIESVALYTEADRDSLHIDACSESHLIGVGPAAQSYLDVEKILAIAKQSDAQAIHPGYGFLSENAEFASRCEAEGITFLGPTPEQMRLFGRKHTAREQAILCNIPLLPGTGLLRDVTDALTQAKSIGYPVMLKSTAGGGGIGMRKCGSVQELQDAWESVASLAKANFSDAGLFLEKFVERARHVEVQIFGDGNGKVVALAERDCSIQRRNQKVIEESPAPDLLPETRRALREIAIRLTASVKYRSAGTVEFVLDAQTQQFWFLEVNTRLQVEHGVSEEVHGVDLVEWMIRSGQGDHSFLDSFCQEPNGHAIQARVYAEDPSRNFLPCAGQLTEVEFPHWARIETWISRGCNVPSWYDPMLAKVIVHCPSRSEAIEALERALEETRIDGIAHNIGYVRHILQTGEFRSGNLFTQFTATLAWTPETIEVIDAGFQTTIQDWPGRQGLWNVGIPPSGPMDALSFRLGNLALGNQPDCAGLEFVRKGPSLRAHRTLQAVLTGADFQATLDGVAQPPWEPFVWNKGSVLRINKATLGARGYLLIQGGLDVPLHLGSRSTFTLGQFGGHGGRALRPGDQLPLFAQTATTAIQTIPAELRPNLTHDWEIGVLLGPHAAPDYFQLDDLEDLFTKPYTVHFNSDRTGVRLVGPKPRWARTDGGEAGLHPSNLHDNAYVVGTVDFTGDTPVILGPDGPSLGGFACPVTLALSELWKLGQLAVGDTLRFKAITWGSAHQAQLQQQKSLTEFAQTNIVALQELGASDKNWQEILPEVVVYRSGERNHLPEICIRQDGDDALLIEFGPMVLDIELRLRAQVLYQELENNSISGILDLTPGIRSLQVRFDPLEIARDVLLQELLQRESTLPDIQNLEIPNRVVYLPLSWDDPQTRLAIEKYMATVRPDAPWCPSNLEFIRRMNGLDSIDAVQKIVFDAQYLVMGLGDVYLGAPVATPLDPRHRLVTTKYNPARTWTPENAVGIGGAYLCVYGMEGPGGYQFVGRTIQMWNRWKENQSFVKPWLLRFFDILRFYPVSQEELLQIREDFPRGRWHPRTEPSTFRARDYQEFLQQESTSIEAFREQQKLAFSQERAQWKTVENTISSEDTAHNSGEGLVPEGCEAITSDMPGSVWKFLVEVGDHVESGQTVAILESMKMESPLSSNFSGIVESIWTKTGTTVLPGQTLMVIRT